MGFFLTFSIFNNNDSTAVQEELKKYTSLVNGGFEISQIEQGNPNFCSIVIRHNKTIVTYPNDFTEYIQTSEILSKSLQRTVYTFSIYDGDYWMLYIIENGILSSRFNPIPEYWTEKRDRQQLDTWNFDLNKLHDDFDVQAESVDNYFIQWKNIKKKTKAYNDDEFYYGDCFQVFDLLKRFSITYSDVTNSERQGTTFKLWTSNLPLQETLNITFEDIRKAKRYSTNYIRLSDAEIEYLLGINFGYFIEHLTTRQNCSNCKVFKSTDKMEIYDYYLSIKDVMIKATGYCKKCGKKIETGFGLTNIKKLLEVLNS